MSGQRVSEACTHDRKVAWGGVTECAVCHARRACPETATTDTYQRVAQNAVSITRGALTVRVVNSRDASNLEDMLAEVRRDERARWQHHVDFVTSIARGYHEDRCDLECDVGGIDCTCIVARAAAVVVGRPSGGEASFGPRLSDWTCQSCRAHVARGAEHACARSAEATNEWACVHGVVMPHASKLCPHCVRFAWQEQGRESPSSSLRSARDQLSQARVQISRLLATLASFADHGHPAYWRGRETGESVSVVVGLPQDHVLCVSDLLRAHAVYHDIQKELGRCPAKALPKEST